MYEIKTFQARDRLDLEELVNTWLKNKDIEIIDIKFVVNSGNNNKYVMFTYKNKEK